MLGQLSGICTWIAFEQYYAMHMSFAHYKDVYIHIYIYTYINIYRCIYIIYNIVSKKLCVPKARLTIDKCAFSVAAPTIWNLLPITVKSSDTIDTFCKIKTENIYLKLLFHHKLLAVVSSNDNFCLSPCMTMTSQMILFVAFLSMNFSRI